MNRDERIRNQLSTVISAAVRLGMTHDGMSRESLAAEVRDLVELALQVAAHVPGELSADGEKYLAWQKAEGQRRELFWREALLPTVPAPSNAMPDGASCMSSAPADDMHDHMCSKDAGHADGPGGSDHLCEQCGQLFTSPTDTTDDDVEIEL